MVHYQTIAIEEIFDTHLYDIHPFLKNEPAPAELIESINKTGILHPPVVLQDLNGSYDVVCGRQRLKCATDILQNSKCLCRLLSHGTKAEELLLIILEDQFSHNELTIIEQSYFVHLCRNLLSENRDLKSFLFSFPQGRITSGLNFLIPLTDLDNSLQKQIHYSVVSEKIIGELLKYSDRDQIILVDLIENLQLGVNNQKKLLGSITELLHRNEMSLYSLLAEDDIVEVLDHPEMNNPQKVTQLFSILHKMCYPLLSTAEDNFKRDKARLQLPEHCQLNASRSFENDELTLSIKFKNMSTLEKVWSKIAGYLP